ncbi:hypothetical protein BATDEDRAFT_23422 [Batrachochytrium dendrobatidis JAM81]|uniref:Uncharacterized protein n=1 Tax=Batrachochytrium dendrobatidis (strain JAM81 / FGSC 10211) TaxID=684364 RepID=F4NYZ4_BATDJ|nr:uncharacterized protein BATDEDRAFT_23422 [Batrachochytrium dendrobatidis JAM81]EGF81795.1 hypothetical protein BATDEDRAFT_23422 [Batrachochytrium dendrobatidis JAM81]|eukprot:XP_006677276.1 hypothetical protein BATDEDRAFT_23422 [Batrachochytrium dendrobatidis JAM81]
MLVIPSCSLRSKHIRSIPINQIILDPANKHKYIIEEKLSTNNTLSKVAAPYFGEEEPLALDVDDKHLKIANPKRYEQIKYYLGDEKYYSDDKYLYTARNGIVYAAKINGTLEQTEDTEEFIKSSWKKPDLLHFLMLGQKRLQTKLLDVLTKESIEKEIHF